MVLGAGQMGFAIVWDLVKSNPENRVIVADSNPESLKKIKKKIQNNNREPNIRTEILDITDLNKVKILMSESDVTINATSYKFNVRLTKIAILTGCHFCDLGGNETAVAEQVKLRAEAKKKKITVVPACGLAPGMANVIAVHLFNKFDSVDEIQLRVGGLPQKPKPPLNYQIVFSTEGLINEYIEPATVIENGKIKKVPSLKGLENISFPKPYVNMEAFYTSGGIGELPGMLKGKVNKMNYKTIRFAGHCEKMRILLGFPMNSDLTKQNPKLKNRKLIEDSLTKNIDFRESDVVLARVSAAGKINGQKKQMTLELIDKKDNKNNITAMMRTTSFPTSIIAQMLAEGKILKHGVWGPEECVDTNLFLSELKKRKILWQEN